MKSLTRSFVLLICIGLLFPTHASSFDQKQAEAAVSDIDAVQAMEIANQWKWSHKDIKSYVTPWEIVFKFPDGKINNIPLPPDKMIVAIAPYIKRTHR